jgi:hypothetical protein
MLSKVISYELFMALFTISLYVLPTGKATARCTSLLRLDFGLNLHIDLLKQIVEDALFRNKIVHSV